MLLNCIQQPQTYLAVFIMNSDGSATLDFIQNIEYKFIELLSLPFAQSEQEVVRQQITYRYNSVKSKVNLMEARLQDVNSMVKLKNPSLLMQIQRGVTPGQKDRKQTLMASRMGSNF